MLSNIYSLIEMSTIVTLTKPVKVRFSDGKTMTIRIFNKRIPYKPNEFRIRVDTPLAKAILGKKVGSTVEYRVGNHINKVDLIID